MREKFQNTKTLGHGVDMRAFEVPGNVVVKEPKTYDAATKVLGRLGRKDQLAEHGLAPETFVVRPPGMTGGYMVQDKADELLDHVSLPRNDRQDIQHRLGEQIQDAGLVPSDLHGENIGRFGDEYKVIDSGHFRGKDMTERGLQSPRYVESGADPAKRQRKSMDEWKRTLAELDRQQNSELRRELGGSNNWEGSDGVWRKGPKRELANQLRPAHGSQWKRALDQMDGGPGRTERNAAMMKRMEQERIEREAASTPEMIRLQIEAEMRRRKGESPGLVTKWNDMQEANGGKLAGPETFNDLMDQEWKAVGLVNGKQNHRRMLEAEKGRPLNDIAESRAIQGAAQRNRGHNLTAHGERNRKAFDAKQARINQRMEDDKQVMEAWRKHGGEGRIPEVFREAFLAARKK